MLAKHKAYEEYSREEKHALRPSQETIAVSVSNPLGTKALTGGSWITIGTLVIPDIEHEEYEVYILMTQWQHASSTGRRSVFARCYRSDAVTTYYPGSAGRRMYHDYSTLVSGCCMSWVIRIPSDCRATTITVQIKDEVSLDAVFWLEGHGYSPHTHH